MINAVLHHLTNKADSFGHSMFPNTSSYEPTTEGANEYALRDFLKLRESSDIEYLLGALAAVYSFPEILEEFGETGRSFRLEDYRRTEYSLTGGKLVDRYDKSPSVAYTPEEYPWPTQTTISYLNATKVRLVRGAKTEEVPYLLRETEYLDIDWPEDLGITGIVQLLGFPWEDQRRVTINHPPNSYPYDACGQKIKENTQFLEHLDERGLVSPFYSAQTGLEQVALACLSLKWPNN